MRYSFLACSLVAGTVFFTACQNNGKGDAGKADTTVAPGAAQPVAAITLSDVPASPDFADAQLALASATAAKQGADSAKVSFAFNVKGYDLKANTPDADHKDCSNSDKGQHIHFIMDNQPYTALYEPKHEVTVANNSEHTVVCFLSRSYHESIKHKGASVVYHFKVDANGGLKVLDAKDPMLVYSRPKGEYIGKDTANVLLDWYLVNAELGANYKVKADIKNETSGATASFTLGEWKPKFIEHLGVGKCSVMLTLVDKDGKTVGNAVTRNFTLAAGEPIK